MWGCNLIIAKKILKWLLFFQKVAALAFVPPAFVRVAWQGIQQDAPDDDERVDTLLTTLTKLGLKEDF